MPLFRLAWLWLGYSVVGVLCVVIVIGIWAVIYVPRLLEQQARDGWDRE